MRGPLLVVANHPNSFLDAIIIGSQFERPVHFLARGDAFDKPWHAKLLRLLNMIPVYRLSEGKENLSLNQEAFRKSEEILSASGIVLIFIEGICVHQHALQPFKKGAARIALESREKKNLQIIPVGVAYNSFERFGKSVNLIIGAGLTASTLFPFEGETKNIRHFNHIMYQEIGKRIVIPNGTYPISRIKKALLFFPGITGYILHITLYAVLKNYLKRKTTGTVFFDSVLFGVLILLYPVYVLVICLALAYLHVPALWVAAVFIFHPVSAWCAVHRRPLK